MLLLCLLVNIKLVFLLFVFYRRTSDGSNNKEPSGITTGLNGCAIGVPRNTVSNVLSEKENSVPRQSLA